jgi:hypothetical protein
MLTVKELKKRLEKWPETDIDGSPTYVYVDELPIKALYHFNFRSNKNKHAADVDMTTKAVES